MANLIESDILNALPSDIISELYRMDNSTLARFIQKFKKRRRYMATAYFCLVLPLGIHYLYIKGNNWKNWVYAGAFFLSFGGLSIWWAIDIIRTYFLIRKHNSDVAIEILRKVQKEKTSGYEKIDLEYLKLTAEIQSLSRSNRAWVPILPAVIGGMQLITVIVGAVIFFRSGFFNEQLQLNKMRNEKLMSINDEMRKNTDTLRKNNSKLSSSINFYKVEEKATERKLNITEKSLKAANFQKKIVENENSALSTFINHTRKLYVEIIINDIAAGTYDRDIRIFEELKTIFDIDKSLVYGIIQNNYTDSTSSENHKDNKAIRFSALNYYLESSSDKRNAFLNNISEFVKKYRNNENVNWNSFNFIDNYFIWTIPQIDENHMVMLENIPDTSFFMTDAVNFASHYIFLNNDGYSDNKRFSYLPRIYNWLRDQLTAFADFDNHILSLKHLTKGDYVKNLLSYYKVCPPCYLALKTKIIKDNYYLSLSSILFDEKNLETNFQNIRTNSKYVDLDPQDIAYLKILNIIQVDIAIQLDQTLASKMVNWRKKFNYPSIWDEKYLDLNTAYSLYMEDIVAFASKNEDLMKWLNYSISEGNRIEYLNSIK